MSITPTYLLANAYPSVLGLFAISIPLLITLALVAISVVSLWKVFEKAGKPGWASIIPIYNTIVWLQIIKKPEWWVILTFIPFVNVLVVIYIVHELSKAFGKDVAFTAGLIFLPIIFMPILAFGDAKYVLDVRPEGFEPPTFSV